MQQFLSSRNSKTQRALALSIAGMLGFTTLGSHVPTASASTTAVKKATTKKVSKKTSTKKVSTKTVPPSTVAASKVDSYGPLGILRNVGNAIGADQLWSSGITGAGIDIAVLDSGIANVRGLERGTKVLDGFSSVPPVAAGASLDEFGHGTHMAGIAGGFDASAGFQGIAPGARLIDIRVADGQGNTDLKQVVDGINWTIENRTTGGRNIKVLLIALAAVPLPTYADDPLAVAVEDAWHAGITVVVSAGNGGEGALASPGYDPYVLTIGSVDPRGTKAPEDDRLALFTSGPNVANTRRADVSTPGMSIVSLRSPGSYIDANAGEGIINEHELRGSGTSQSAAVAAGAAALLLQKYPSANPDQIKHLLRISAWGLTQDRPRSGSGAMRLDRAITAGLPAVSVSAQTWPRAEGLPTVEVDSMRPSTIKIATGFASSTPGATGNTWTGNTWTGNTWTGNTWTGSTWTGSSWR
jgi:serine protease AprX